MQQNWLLKKLLRKPRERLKKKREGERLLNLLLIDNSSKTKKQPLLRRHALLKRLKSKKQLELLQNRLLKKLLPILL